MAPEVPSARLVITPHGRVTLRPLRPDDSLATLTAILHAAYAGLAAQGFRYWATHQSVADTADRVRDACCLVAEQEGQLIGTISGYPPEHTHGCDWYDRPEVAKFGQFGVDPAWHRGGIGAQLLSLIEQWAPSTGATELACDTAEGATHLRRWYAARGYREVDRADWPDTNYVSVILSLTLA